MADTELQQLAKTDRNPVQETRYQELLKQQGAGGGTEGIDMSQVPSVQQYVQGQFAAEDPVLRDLIMQMRSQEKPLDIYGRLETEAGLPELRGVSTSLSKEIAAIEDYLDQIEPDVSARTRESLVTEAQRRGMVAAGREPFLQKLGKVGTALGRISGRISEAERGIGIKTELGLRGQEMELEPFKLRYQVMVDRNSRLLSGFTADRQTLLDSLYDKLQRQRYLSDREWEQANALAAEERQYMKSLQTVAAQAGAKLTGQESADDILALIGTTAAEAIGWERGYKERALAKTGGGTQSDREAAAATVALRRDVQGGATFEDVVRRYQDALPIYQIRQEYDAASRYGPAKESEQTIQSWQLTPSQQQKESEPTTYQKVQGNVANLINQNATKEDIETYIRSEGYNPSDFPELSGYEPQKKGWWPF